MLPQMTTLRCITLASLFCLCACDGGTNTTGSATSSDVLWRVPSPLKSTGSLIDDVVATDSLLFVGGAMEVAALHFRDGTVAWKRSDVTSRPPLPVSDSLLVVLSAGESVGLRQRDGAILWRAPVPGTSTTVIPVLVGRFGIFATYAGDLFAADVYTGAVRKLAGIRDLTSAEGQIWGLAAKGDTVLVLSQRVTVADGRTSLWLARVLPAAGTVVSSMEVPSPSGTFATAYPLIVSDSLLVATLAGSVGAINLRTNRWQWTAGSANITSRVATRDGRLYAGTGDGTILVYDLVTGGVTQRLPLNLAGISDVFPCREGIVFTSGAVYRVNAQLGSPVQTLVAHPATGSFVFSVWRTGVLGVSSTGVDVAVRCT
jgi:outer membrane protein assembly factor BamB